MIAFLGAVGNVMVLGWQWGEEMEQPGWILERRAKEKREKAEEKEKKRRETMGQKDEEDVEVKVVKEDADVAEPMMVGQSSQEVETPGDEVRRSKAKRFLRMNTFS